MANFDSVSGVMADLLVVFQSKDDMETIKSIQGKHQQLLKRCSAREAQIKQMLQDLQSTVLEVQERATAGDLDEVHRQRVAGVQREKELTRSSISRLEEEAKHLEEFCEALREEAGILEEKRSELERLAREQMPRTVYELSLYANITGIMWDHDEPDRAKGNVTNAAMGDIKPFDLDPKAMPDFQLNNALWELID